MAFAALRVATRLLARPLVRARASWPERVRLIAASDVAEPGSAREHTVGFVAALPRAGAQPPPAAETDAGSVERIMRDYDVVHASAELGRDFVARFVQRKQQIGQVELVAALLPYLSLLDEFGRSRLASRRCLHWIDNSSAVAALVIRW